MSRLLRKRFADLKRFAREKRGATAVEFALISIPFLLLLFGVVEIGMLLLVSATLDTAVEFASRNVRTGEFQQSAGVDADSFKGLVCRNMTWLQNSCENSPRVVVEAETFDNFADLGAANSPDPTTFDPDDRCWSVGGPKDIVLMRVYYQWDLITPMLNNALENMGDGRRMLVSASAFRNEPYDPNIEKVGAGC
ncbi:pilus assembly protein [Phenylobacterium sp.]|uniref:TadE/TadG family type IV pilus assembly protein n=1 Tax=Phenylobacterium sp. TaxID=1871053 RepID=UPI00286CD9FC|nr:pilus assembly protein [Phenylobacterium sp.]